MGSDWPRCQALSNNTQNNTTRAKMQHNSLFRLLFCPDLTIAMLSLQVFQPVPSNLYN